MSDHASDPPADKDRTRSGSYVPYAVQLAASWAWRLVLIVGAVFLLFRALQPITGVVIVPFLVAVLLTALTMPFRNLLVNHHVPRGVAAATTVIGLIIVVAGLLTLVGQQIVVGFSDMSDQVAEGYEQILAWLQTGPFGLDASRLPEYIDSAVTEVVNAAKENSSSLIGGTLNVASSTGEFFVGAVLALFCMIFLLYDGEGISRWLVRLLPRRAREKAWGAGERGWTTLAGYVKVQVLVAFVDAVGIAIGAAILQLPLVVPIGVLVFLGSFIPIVGALVTGTIAVLIALVANGWISALIMLGVVILVQQLESHVLQPFIMGKAVSVHPIAVVLAITGFSSIFGIVGALIAVPSIAVVNRVVLYLAGHSDPVPDEHKRKKKRRTKGGEVSHSAADASDDTSDTPGEVDVPLDGGPGADR